MTSNDLVCRVCAADALLDLPGFSGLPRVTSDCKAFAAGGRLAVCQQCGAVQKPADARWHSDAAAIYRTYEPYFQSGGIEQAVFDSSTGTPRLRSAVVVDRLIEQQSLGPTGRIIDVGCGNGALLHAFAAARPQWDIYGHELSTLNLPSLKGIPGFRHLHTCNLAELPGQFDVITMMHSLEHFDAPATALSDLARKLAPGGCLFIQVPNAEVTPFDLLVADHASHFTKAHLTYLLERVGLTPQVVADSWVTKELSAVTIAGGTGKPMMPATAAPVAAVEGAQGQIAWLQATIAEARSAAQGSQSFGIFGTSIAAMWLTGALGSEVDFFVDEDPSRKGTTLLGKPVLTPADVAAGSQVFVALIPAVAAIVAKRLARPGVTYIEPPAA